MTPYARYLAVGIAVSLGTLPALAQKKAVEPLPDEAVVAFVEEHHPELSQLLVRLQKESEPEYARAIREIRSVAERVVRFGGKQTPRAAYEIDRWKLDSRIRLLTARMVSLMAEPAEGVENPNLEPARQQLHELATERVKLERDRLERDKKVLLERLEKLQEQSYRIDKDMDAAIERQFNALTRNVETAARKRGVGAKRSKMKPDSTSNTAPAKISGNKPAAKTVVD